MNEGKDLAQEIIRRRTAETARFQAGINIEELLNTPPALGVEYIISEVRSRFDELERRHYVEQCMLVNVDPDALLKTAKKNADLMTALEHARELIAAEIFEALSYEAIRDRHPFEGELLYFRERDFEAIKNKYLKGETNT